MAILFGRVQFTVIRGTRWEDDISLTDRSTGEAVDLSGIEGIIMRIREAIDTEIVMELSVANGRLVVINGVGGILGVRVDSADMLDFPENDHERARYVYDAVIERSPDEYEAAIDGTVYVLPQVTRPWGAE